MVRCHVGRRGRAGAQYLRGTPDGLSFARPSGRAFFASQLGCVPLRTASLAKRPWSAPLGETFDWNLSLPNVEACGQDVFLALSTQVNLTSDLG